MGDFDIELETYENEATPAFFEGFYSALSGEPEDSNMYDPSEERFAAWQEGWHMAKAGITGAYPDGK